MFKNTHSIPESSSFFQGNTEQFFTRNFGKNLSFRVNHIYWDSEEEFNVEKYRAEFCRRINNLISNRLNDGGTGFHTVTARNLAIKPVKLAKDEDDFCGNFIIYPPTGICKAKNSNGDLCNTYFVFNEGRKCGHKDNDPWIQFTFLAFCNICGRTLPLHYMSTIKNDCKSCGAKDSMRELKWPRGGKENIKKYKVKCIKCGEEVDLRFQKCNHNNGELSGKDINKYNFRAVPARANAILHPLVISIPDVSQENKSLEHVNISKAASFAFSSFFGYEIEESKLYSPEFRSILQEKSDFWKSSRVEPLIEDILDKSDIEMSDIKQASNQTFSKILKNVLTESHSKMLDSQNKESILKKYGINHIKEALHDIKNIKFDEDDLQGLNLVNSRNSSKKESPDIITSNYENWLDDHGLEKICHFSNLSMVQALLGIVEGSTRRNPLLFKTIEVNYPNKNPIVYVRKYNTEGILFQLNLKKILKWLDKNKAQLDISDIILPLGNYDIMSHYRKLVMNDRKCETAVKTLLHTYSHMLIQQSSVSTGLDTQSISEIIYPSVASFLIYSTNNINIGGLEYVYNYHLESWFSIMKDLAQECPQDPACMIDEGGACNSCSYLPEFVCCNFNNDLDRSTLIGGSERYLEGYFK